MQPAELEISSDPDNLNGSDIMKKMTRKKSLDDNLSMSLINSPKQKHTLIEVDESNELLDADITHGSIKMSSLSHDSSSFEASLAAQSYHSRSCLQNLYHSLCSCYNPDHRVMLEYEGSNLICCGRHLLTGPLSQFSTLTMTLVLVLGPLYGFYWLSWKLWYYQMDDALAFTLIMLASIPLTFMSIYFLFKTNFTDPGIIPRASRESPMNGPLNEYDRFCNTCYVIRPAKAKHCSICGNCVLGFDHHC